MVETIGFLIGYIFALVIMLYIWYRVIKRAVREGIKEAKTELDTDKEKITAAWKQVPEYTGYSGTTYKGDTNE
jgi:uncharacterized membrane-anchored protein YhcB (DUF1043 family)